MRSLLRKSSFVSPSVFKIRQFIIYYARLLVHLSKRTTDQASDVPSIIFFSQFLAKSFPKIVLINYFIFL